MSDTGDKTEEPTDKKLKDARKKGDVAKSKDVTSAAGLMVWLVLASTSVTWAARQFVALLHTSLNAFGQPFHMAAAGIGMQALHTLLAVTAATVLPVAAVGSLVEFLQTGPVFSLDKLHFKLDKFNPVQGLQRMVSMDKLIEVAKSLAKTVVLLAVGWITVRSLLAPAMQLLWSRQPELLGPVLWAGARPVLGWAAALVAGMAVLDTVFQRHSFLKKMRMSKYEIKQEDKNQNGDPHIKGAIRQLQTALAMSAPVAAARSAAAVVVNPTHITIAIDYDRDTHPVPVVAAIGTDELARAMREAAESAGVPIVRNIALARELMARAETGDAIPNDLFDVIAEVILWADEVREDMEALRRGATVATSTRRRPPGEDRSRYAGVRA